MNKTLFLTILICACFVGISQARSESGQLQNKEARKPNPEKARQKAIVAANDSIAYEIALRALKNQNFVMEADRISFKRGENAYLNSTTNFISMHNGRATVQLAFTHALRSGPNGLGGITVEGHPSNVEMKMDKRGNPTFSMNVMGTGISAQVSIFMFKGSNKATVTVNPNFNSNTIRLTGYLVPWDESSVYKGRPL